MTRPTALPGPRRNGPAGDRAQRRQANAGRKAWPEATAIRERKAGRNAGHRGERRKGTRARECACLSPAHVANAAPRNHGQRDCVGGAVIAARRKTADRGTIRMRQSRRAVCAKNRRGSRQDRPLGAGFVSAPTLISPTARGFKPRNAAESPMSCRRHHADVQPRAARGEPFAAARRDRWHACRRQVTGRPGRGAAPWEEAAELHERLLSDRRETK